MLCYCFNTILVTCFVAFVMTLVSTSTILKEYRAYSTVYGEPMDVITTPSLIECARTCSRNATCRSAIFENTGTCTPNKGVAHVSNICGTPGECSDPIAAIYVEKIPKTTMNQYCQGDSDCVDLKSACVLGQCQCEPGYHFDGNNYACVASCSSYGSTFTADVNYRINANNVAHVKHVTLETCKELCLTATGYVCVTFDYGSVRAEPDTVYCRLQNVTASDVPTEFEPYVGISLYKRDCATL